MVRKIPPIQVEIARSLVASGWTHDRVAKHMKVSRSAISYALTKRKTGLPKTVDRIVGECAGMVTIRLEKAAREAVAKTLREIAAEMEAK
jgi:predicted transcriptional regulator